MLNIIGWFVARLIVGAIARLLMPGRQPMGILVTMLLGIVGALLGGGISWLIWGNPGEPFSTFMRTRIFEPLGMTGTTFDSAVAPVADRVTFYYQRFNEDSRLGTELENKVDYSCFAGAGAIQSTPSDLVRFANAIGTGRLLRPDTVELMYDAGMPPVPGYPDKPPRAGRVQALLWDVEADADGRRVVKRDGGVKGFGGCLVNYPREGVAAAVLYNSNGPPTCDAAEGLARFFLPPVPPRP